MCNLHVRRKFLILSHQLFESPSQISYFSTNVLKRAKFRIRIQNTTRNMIWSCIIQGDQHDQTRQRIIQWLASRLGGGWETWNPITRRLTNRLRTLSSGWIRLHSSVICPIPFQSWSSKTPGYLQCLDTFFVNNFFQYHSLVWRSLYSLIEWQSCFTFVTPKKSCSVHAHASTLSPSAQKKRNIKSSYSVFIWQHQNTWPFARDTARAQRGSTRATLAKLKN